MEIDDSLIKNRYGYYEVKNKPGNEELRGLYLNYFGSPDSDNRPADYSEEEVNYTLNKLEQKYQLIMESTDIDKEKRSFLDVGTGEGWALRFFKDKGWDSIGLDYTDTGCKRRNPDCLKHLRVGDAYDSLAGLTADKAMFDIIWLDNVLEHLPDPYTMLVSLSKLITDTGMLMVEVPNDFSPIQRHLVDEKIVSKPFWQAALHHLSYFNADGLKALGSDAGWECKSLLSDFPIELFLFNGKTNYVDNPSTGKSCHLSRIKIENMLHNISPQKTNEMYKALAKLNIGRVITGFFQKKQL